MTIDYFVTKLILGGDQHILAVAALEYLGSIAGVFAVGRGVDKIAITHSADRVAVFAIFRFVVGQGWLRNLLYELRELL